MGSNTTNLVIPNKYRDTETKPERRMQSEVTAEKKVAVVYYLSRNGQLEHPHFMEVPLSSPQGLLMQDVLRTLNLLRGEGMANMYAWSSKRSYKNGFVWQDLSDNDLVQPSTHAHEYILKGSLIFESISLRHGETSSSSLSKLSSEVNSSSEDSDSPIVTRRRNNSWSSLGDFGNSHHEQQKQEAQRRAVYKAKTGNSDHHEQEEEQQQQQRGAVYKVKAESGELARNVSTQTENGGSSAELGVRNEHQRVGNMKQTKESLEPLPNGEHPKIGIGKDGARKEGKASNVLKKVFACGKSKKFNDHKH